MNDCIWAAIGACNGPCRCKSYVSLNSDKGAELIKRYEKEIDPIVTAMRETAGKNFAERSGYTFPGEHKYRALDINTGAEVVGYYWTNGAGNHFIRVTEKEAECEGLNIKKIVCDDVEIARRTLEKL
jgi:hypothetical protein